LKTRRYPIETINTNTTWNYNPDDSITSVIDPRGAAAGFAYNDARGLLTGITYSSPNQTQIPLPDAVSFSYDAVGNRTQMTDGTGTTNYSYNQLSKLTSENKSFSGLLGSFQISYGYNLSGSLISYIDPFQQTFNYALDKTGRLTDVSGTAFGDHTSGEYVSGIKYRTWGAIKELTYKTLDNNLISKSYDTRLRFLNHQTTSTAGANPSASEPEWMCQAADAAKKDFFLRPSHCQNAIMQNFDFSLEKLFSARTERGNPARINGNSEQGNRPTTPPTLKKTSRAG
jgi:YD repeat-containing protein